MGRTDNDSQVMMFKRRCVLRVRVCVLGRGYPWGEENGRTLYSARSGVRFPGLNPSPVGASSGWDSGRGTEAPELDPSLDPALDPAPDPEPEPEPEEE